MTHERPDPDELLARTESAARRERRGRLEIFFGAAPGVGKTYAMLEAARVALEKGVDVVAGVIETHGREATSALEEGFPRVPLRRVEYRGTVLFELDADAAIARRPAVLLVDELAHTNAPASRHEKRWQDVLQVLAAGIDVWSTLNVQHIESVNDIVTKITGVPVRETVPDAIFDEADEVKLVDLPPEELHERLKQGQVYVGEVAATALDGFFRRGNLEALRELALRKTAEWVDAEMRRYKFEKGIRAIWPAATRILVAVSPSPLSADLVRAAHRMAAGLRAAWIAVWVETPSTSRADPAARDRALRTLRLAESLGAETVLASGEDVAGELIALGRTRNVDRIIVGKSGRAPWRERFLGSMVHDLIAKSGDINVYVIRGERGPAADAPRKATTVGAFAGPWLRPLLVAVSGIVGATALGQIIFQPPDLSIEVLVYVLGVAIVAAMAGRRASVIASCLAIVSFNIFCVPPRFSMTVANHEDLLIFAVLLAVGLAIGSLMAVVREQAERARETARRTSGLLAMMRDLASARDRDEIADATRRHVASILGSESVVFVLDGSIGGAVQLSLLGPAPKWCDERETAVARFAFDHGQPAGRATSSLPSAGAIHVPLRAVEGKLGVLSVRLEYVEAATSEWLLTLESLARQVAVAIERTRLVEDREAARVQVEGEKLRSALLSSVSHDLRTPLASIAGAASSLFDPEAALAPQVRRDLEQSILDESRRLAELIENLLFATRLGAGGVDVRREWLSIEELVGAVLHRYRDRLGDRPTRIDIPADLPLIRGDERLLEQVLSNLLDNALVYSPPESPIEINAAATAADITMTVADEGPGFEEGEEARVFDRFYRGRSATKSGGLGLGLAIAHGIVTAHGGRIRAERRPGGGAVVRFSLPRAPQDGVAEIER